MAAVAFFIFNRPDLTARVFQRIRAARPRRLLIVADGPRPDISEDKHRCRQTRELVLHGIDWPCEVNRNFAESNLGCRRRVSSGIDWVFEQDEAAIILEDDCVPELSFFEYCFDLLQRFRDDERVMQICGTNVDPAPNPAYSYTFSKFGPVWGWASWRRAWRSYDVHMSAWQDIRSSVVSANLWEFAGEAELREPLYNALSHGEIDTWDYQWGFAKYLNSGLSIIPSTNLISNIGFGPGATHTFDENSAVANMVTQALPLPLRHYPAVLRDKETDWRFHRKMTPSKFLNT